MIFSENRCPLFGIMLLENRSVADDVQWGRAVRRAFMRELASRRPRTALQNLRQRQRDGVHSDALAQTFRHPGEQPNRQRRMPPAIAERYSAKHQSRRPDRAQMVEERGKDDGCRDPATTRLFDQMVEEAAGTRIIGTA